MQGIRGPWGSEKKEEATRLNGPKVLLYVMKMAEPTGFEPATSDVTGRRSNQLNYSSATNSKTHYSTCQIRNVYKSVYIKASTITFSSSDPKL